jgi:hypothetical protein
MATIVEALDIHTYNALMTELQGGIEMDSLTFLKELPERQDHRKRRNAVSSGFLKSSKWSNL